jgi:cytochrome bd ubiquinol oxidase subunit I
LHTALALGPVAQDHLLQARPMQALLFIAHIPLVCFSIAFPVMVLLVEWRGQRAGDPLHQTIARRWSRLVIALFVIGDVRLSTAVAARCSGGLDA